MPPDAPLEVVEFTDISCPWVWGSEPKFRLLRWRYGDLCRWRHVFANMMPAEPGPPDPRIQTTEQLREMLRDIYETTGAAYSEGLLRSPPHPGDGSPFPPGVVSGLAHCAARLQGRDLSESSLRRLREYVWLYGETPKRKEDIAFALEGLPGLDLARLCRDLADPEIRSDYERDFEEARTPNTFIRGLPENENHHLSGSGAAKTTDGRQRYAVPTLLFRGSGGELTVPGWQDLERYLEAMEKAEPGSTRDPRPDPTPEEAFEKWSLLTGEEFEMLCGAATAIPENVESFDLAKTPGAGSGWVHLRADAHPALLRRLGSAAAVAAS
jgi:predicted DsbA family dithiol-disulfide isomerase